MVQIKQTHESPCIPCPNPCWRRTELLCTVRNDLVSRLCVCVQTKVSFWRFLGQWFSPPHPSKVWFWDLFSKSAPPQPTSLNHWARRWRLVAPVITQQRGKVQVWGVCGSCLRRWGSYGHYLFCTLHRREIELNVFLYFPDCVARVNLIILWIQHTF